MRRGIKSALSRDFKEIIIMTKERKQRRRSILTAALLLIIWGFLLPMSAHAQWTSPDASGNINSTNSGRVGVGTNTPAGKLDVSAPDTGTNPVYNDTPTAIWIKNTGTGTTGMGSALIFGSANGTRMSGIYGVRAGTTGSEGDLVFATNPAFNFLERMRITSAGNVGIGTGTPVGRFEIVNTSGSYTTSNYFQITGTTADNNNYPGISFKGGSYVNEYPFIQLGNAGLSLTVAGGRQSSTYPNRMQLVLSTNSNGAGHAGFQLFNGSTTTDLLTVKDNGFVGIGTPAPSKLFHILGSSAGIRLQDSTSDTVAAYPFMEFYGSSTRIGWVGDGSATLDTMDVVSEKSGGVVRLFTGGTAAANERIRIDASGQVGIGTDAPAVKLDVNGQIKSRSGGFVFPDGTVQTTASTGGGGASQWTTSGTSITYNAGNVGIGTTTPDPAYRLEVAGDVKVTGNIAAKYQDLAEWVPSSQRLLAGTVVILDPEKSNQVIASTEPYDTRVAGVISDQPGVLLGEGGEGKVKVATTGRVRVKVDATSGPIRVGDILVSSGVEGVAMKSQPVNVGGVLIHRPGTIVGKALERLEGGRGEILVLLSLQ
jgi:hypothetical protein